MFTKCFKGVSTELKIDSRKCQECLKEVPRMIEGSFKSVSQKF